MTALSSHLWQWVLCTQQTLSWSPLSHKVHVYETGQIYLKQRLAYAKVYLPEFLPSLNSQLEYFFIDSQDILNSTFVVFQLERHWECNPSYYTYSFMITIFLTLCSCNSWFNSIASLTFSCVFYLPLYCFCILIEFLFYYIYSSMLKC